MSTYHTCKRFQCKLVYCSVPKGVSTGEKRENYPTSRKMPAVMCECELVGDQYSDLVSSASPTLLPGRRPIELLCIFAHGKITVETEIPKP